MKEVSRLLSFKQLRTTPYHPVCYGPLERFRRTIESMLVSVCAQQPADWGKSFLSGRLSKCRESQDGRVGDKSQVCVISMPTLQVVNMAYDDSGDVARTLSAEEDRGLPSGEQRELVQYFSGIVSELPERTETEKPAREVKQRNVEKG